MSEFEEKINALLGNPEEMEKITRMAAQLMGAPKQENPSADASAGEPPRSASAALFPGLDADMLSKIGRLLSKAGGTQNDKLGPLRALGPYLSPERREKMEKAIKFAHIAKLAGLAMEEYGGGKGV